MPAAPSLPAFSAASAVSARSSRSTAKKWKRARARLQRGWRRHQSSKSPWPMEVHSTVGGDLVNHCINDILSRARSRCFSSTTSRWGNSIPTFVEQLVEGMSRSCRRAGCASSAVRPPRCPASIRPASMISQALSSALSNAKNFLPAKASARGHFDCAALRRAAYQRLFPRAQTHL